MKLMFLLLSLALTLPLFAAEECEETSGPSELQTVLKAAKMVESSCPMVQKNQLGRICYTTFDRSSDPELTYRYRRLIYNYACVDPAKDSEETINKKVQAMWKRNEANLHCNALIFDVINGHPVKWAANLSFDDFIKDAIKWKINFNKVDESDGRTVLDYIKYRMDQGGELSRDFKNYYKWLRDAGAKHKSEL